MLHLKNISKYYDIEKTNYFALKSISFNLNEGELVSITGKSGSGKSTLLNIIGLIDNLSEGEIFFYDRNINQFSEKEKTIFRRDFLGYIFQNFHLIPVLTALENVLLPGILQNRKKKIVEEEAKNLLECVGLIVVLNKQTKFLSGGQKQRVAIARALINQPKLILADEPTANLDKKNSEIIINLLMSLAKKNKATLIVVSHDREISELTEKQICLEDGKICSIKMKDEFNVTTF